MPRSDRSLLAIPGFQQAAGQLRDNQRSLSEFQTGIGGCDFDDLRKRTRDDVLKAAQAYTSQITGGPVAAATADRLVVAGHQPQLFHCGVWAKNFAIARLAQDNSATAIQLVIDNDLMSSPSVRVPTLVDDRPTVSEVYYDDSAGPPKPWEEAVVTDLPAFTSFGQRVVEAMSDWKIAPVIADAWPAAVNVAKDSGQLRDALTAARVVLERQHDVFNLELPLSHVCQLDGFLHFAGHIFSDLPRFQQVHNDVLQQYRSINRIRSRTHPVPALTTLDDGWLEAPFWVWHRGDNERRRIFARRDGTAIALSDGMTTFVTIPDDADPDSMLAGLQGIRKSGLRFRPRALATTLFARLFFADLFVHGIGGAKYDEMTDRIIAEFYGCAPPAFQTLSASMHLQFADEHPVSIDDERRLESQLRDLFYNPQRHLQSDPASMELQSEKHRLIADEQNKGPASSHDENFTRYRRLKQINQELAAVTKPLRQQLVNRRTDTREQLAANAVIASREFSFALFPAERITQLKNMIANSE